MQTPSSRRPGLFAIAKEAVRDFFDDDMTTHASALAYQVLFSIFPFVIFLIALLGFLHLSSFFDWLRAHAEMVFPQQAMPQVNQVINDLQKQQGGLLSLGVLVALWSASAAVRATMNALNVAYDVRETRPAWKLYPLSILYTLGLAVLLIAAAVLLVVGPQAVQWVAQQVGLEQVFVLLWAWLRWPVALFLMALALALIYYAAPNVRHRFRLITPGAVVAVLVWIGASLGFDYYVRNFADYNATYGSIGTIVILLLYFFLSAAVLLFGAEVNAVVERQKIASSETLH
ncbi:MAG TPA: YihY/virulence factor BrkB family protein [Noviherbaspirillum sp.]|jgi:membrane protein|uniref:YihY/virulence factor BrkB family protein n=1 Tax=Noviherbaspirillum sp. TaxID=1926288 RepID=UPI002F951277